MYHGSPRRGEGLPRDVERALAEWVRATDETKVVGPQHTYRELVEEWMKVADHEATTIQGYEGYLRRYLLPAFGTRRVSDIGVQDIDRFYATMRQEGFAPRTIRQAHAILRRSLAMAAKWGWVPFNPAAMTGPELKGLDTKEVEAPAPDEVRLLLKILDQDEPLVGLFVRVSAALGTRRGETCGLRWSDVSGVDRTITVERSVYRVGGGDVCVKGTKTCANGTLAIPESLLDELLGTFAVTVERAEAAGVYRSWDDGYIFTDDVAGRVPWLPDTVSHKVSKVRDQLGLPARLTLKNLRHFHATQLLSAGVDLGTVANRLRHADRATTLKFYATKDEAADRRAGDLWGDIL